MPLQTFSSSATGIVSRALIYGPGLALAWVFFLLLFEVFVSRRAWCRYVCPLGALLGLAARFGALRLVHGGESFTETVIIDDVYSETRFDLSGTRRFDMESGYRTFSMLCVPLVAHGGEVLGVLDMPVGPPQPAHLAAQVRIGQRQDLRGEMSRIDGARPSKRQRAHRNPARHLYRTFPGNQ